MHDYDYVQKSSKSKKSFGRKKSKDSTNISDKVNRNVITAEGGTFSVISKGDNHNTSPEIHAHEHVELLSTEGKVILESDKSTGQHVKNKSGSNFASQKAKGKGKVDETVEEPVMDTSNLTTEGALGTELSLKARGNLEQTLAALAQDPNMAWAAELAKDPAIRVQLEKEYHKHWKYKQSGMTPEFTMVVIAGLALAGGALFAPAAAAGAGAAGAGAAAGGTVATGGAVATTASTVTLGSMGTAAASAVGKAVVSSAIVSGINNKGDLRLIAKDLTSKNQVKNLAITAVTAGAVHGVSGAMNVSASTSSMTARMQNVAIQRGVNVAVSTTIGGEDLKDSLKSNAIGGLVDFGAGLAAQKIGEAYHTSEKAEAFKAEHPDLAYMVEDVRYMSPVEHLVAHGVVGAASGFVLGQNPLIHAATAVGGEVTASAFKESMEGVDSKEQGVALARFASSAIALTLNGDVKDISGAIETGGRAAENNTYLGQKDMEQWEKKRQKKARQLVERGIVTQEEMDANYDSLSIADMAKIKAYHRQYVSSDVKGYGEDLFIKGVQAYQDREQAQQAFREGDRRPEIRLKSGYIFNAKMNYEVFIPRSSIAADVNLQPETPLEQMRVASIKSERDVDPSSPFQWSELKRDAHKLYGNSGLNAKYDYTRVLSGNLQNPEDYRNLVPFASDLKKLKDRTGSLMHKWGAGTRFYGQMAAMTTGNERLSVDVGHASEFFVDPMIAAGGLLKGARLTKQAVQGVNTAKRLTQSGKGAEAVADVVSAANKGTKITERASQIAKPGLASKTATQQAEQNALHQAENAGRNIDLRVKPAGTAKISRAKDGSRIVEGTQVHHIIPQTLENDKFLKSIGYDIQQKSNKMFLPTVKGDSLLNTNRSFHQGRHVEEVQRGIQKSLDAIKEQKILHGWSNERTIQEIQKQIVTPQRALLREGKIPLNKHFRPEAQDLREEWMMQRLSD